MKTMSGFPDLRRRGLALPMALVVVIIGSALIAFIFNAVVKFNFAAERQQKVYVELTTVRDYIEQAKGTISSLNSTNKEALHRENPDALVGSARDLQITGHNLSLDVPVPERRQAVTLQVFDVAYTQNELQPNLDPKILAAIPAPIVLLTESSMEPKFEMENEGEVETTDIKGDATDTSIFKFDSRELGAYLIRVQLFDVVNRRRVRVRLAEEAFFQTSSPDTP